jgi:anti-anti-sigma factor
VSDALAGGADVVALDLRDVTFIDSTGLQALVRLDDLARAGRRALAIVEGPAVRRLLELTGLGRRFETAA